jgi:glycosidase
VTAYQDDLSHKAQVSLNRLLPRIEPILANLPDQDREMFLIRLQTYFPEAFRLLYGLYGLHYDFYYHLEQILRTVAEMSAARPDSLKALDRQREATPLWFQSEQMMGGVCYVDLFAGNLAGIRARIPYFKELGLTYLHLMPLFRAPEGNNDGGYAVSSYREVSPALGTMDELAELAADLRQNGISLVLDFVFNHTADEHEWALRVLAGDETYQDYYYLFDSRELPDQFEKHLREIFPDQAPGSFTFRREVGKWVWTTFHEFQWDLNYSNPAVFNAMLGEMLFLANQGVEVLRLDAVAFIWKQLGTPCENLPQVHLIIQAYNALVRVAAPSLVFKSEAIVHPSDVNSYINLRECQISYNPTLMALLWEAVATRNVKLLRHSMARRFDINADCTWVNYVRSHDDIGWTFSDEDALEVGINGFNHRQFLNQFYSGKFPGSFAKGVPFNFNPVTLDMRISGTCASLAGLEQALEAQNELFLNNAIRRILLIYGIVLSAGGIPLIYLGDEIGAMNDYRYKLDPAKRDDSRWVHRPPFDETRAARRTNMVAAEGRIFQQLVHLIQVRRNTPAFAGGQAIFFDTGNDHVLGLVRNRAVLVLGNFSDFEQTVSRDALARYWPLAETVTDLTNGESLALDQQLTLAPCQLRWIG